MTRVKTSYGRRSFLKTTGLTSGGLMLGFSWLASCNSKPEAVAQMPKEWFEITGFLKVGDNGMVTIMSPNPEIGQNVKTSMPMIVAEELDVDWNNVIVEQAPLNTAVFTRQLAGGSQSIRQGWEGLRMAGAAARKMLVQAAANTWGVNPAEVTTSEGKIMHTASGREVHFGEVASAAAQLEIPKEVELKEIKDFKIIGTSRKNVDGTKIVTGKPLYGIDYKKDGMKIAMIAHPPAFGLKLKSYDDSIARQMPGIEDVFTINAYPEGVDTNFFDVSAFPELVVVVGNSTWEVMNAKKALQIEWEPFPDYELSFPGFGGEKITKKVPSGLENTSQHYSLMDQASRGKVSVARRDGNPEAAFKKAAKIIERTYTAPFLAHNTMEPMNFFADVTDDGALLAGPIQTPEFLEKTASARLGLPLEKIEVHMTRMGGGFGRRLYGHFGIEAAVISQKIKKPVKLQYTREDDMTTGVYRPSYHAVYRAGLDDNGNLIAFHVRTGGIPETPLFENRFPAGAIDNYLAESWALDSNISIGAFRAPRSNFIAGAEQAFLDEVAETAGKDPIDFRLELLKKAQENPVGENNDYEAARYAGVLELVREKSGWNGPKNGETGRGVSAYFCHNSYVAQVLDLRMQGGKPVIERVCCAVDCGLVVNPDAATNLAQGGVIDGIGHALYSSLSFRDGQPQHSNFNTYRLIRHSEAPKAIDVHFVKSDIAPTGMGEPPFPPVMGAVANALYRATGRRYYNQPLLANENFMG